MKKLLFILLLALLTTAGIGIYSMTRYNIEALIVCASNEKASYLPSFVCENYLYDYRGHPVDIAFLNGRTGLNFLANIENTQIRQHLFEFFIRRGMNINATSNVDGLTPLHAAVLLNDPDLAKLLLKMGANTQVRERTNGFTPLEFLIQMDVNLPGIDRSRLKQVLENSPQ